MNAKFINTLYQPTKGEWLRLWSLQNQMALIKAELSYNLRDCPPNEKRLRIEIFHQNFRKRAITLVKDLQRN